jgi:peptide/nickel transport system permease protein
MTRYVLGRFLSLGISLVLASLVIFTVIEVVPGDPASVMLGLNASPETLAALRADLGLEGGPVARYLGWIAGLLQGDLGVSYTYRVPVADLVADRVAVSLPLALMALGLAMAVGLPAGVWAALRVGHAADLALMAITQLGVALPNFWFAMLLVMVFAVGLGWAPSGGFPGWGAGLGQALGALILPAVALALPQAAILARVMRASLLETLDQDYIRTARAKGLSRDGAALRHGLRNAFVPVLTILGLQFSFLIAGAIIIENVFYLPGLGRLIFQGITQRDLIVVESVVMLLVLAVILVNFATDLAYGAIDPRLRRPGG